MASTHPFLTLHTFYRSSCSARIRTALAYKSILTDSLFHDVTKDAHLSSSYAKINPSTSVPTLEFHDPSNPKKVIRICQSVAILEYLEEAFPDRPRLLPGLEDPLKRARVREMVNVIVADVQPLTSQGSLRRVEKFSNEDSMKAWAAEVTTKGLKVCNTMIKEYGEGGKYSVGNEITMADVCLAPAVENAFRWEVDVKNEMPEVWRVYQSLKDLDAFKEGDWKHQPDTPKQFREGDLEI